MHTLIIGRDANNQIVLDDNMVSRQHAQLIIHDNGQVSIKDFGSSNGTFVNGNKITESYLNPGDVVKCGPIFLDWNQYISKKTEIVDIDLMSAAGKAQEWNNKLLTFINPFLETIDNGSFFRKVFHWIYIAIAILNIILPFYILFKLIDSGLFKVESGKYVAAIVVSWLIFTAVCWFGFQLWWNRSKKVNHSSYGGAEFVTTPLLAHVIQTFGEWYGTLTGVIGFITGLISLIFVDRYNAPYNYDLDFSFFPNLMLPYAGWKLIIFGPLYGFFVVFLFRFISEFIKVLAVIANNTKPNIKIN